MDPISSATAGLTSAVQQLSGVAAVVAKGGGDNPATVVDEASAATNFKANLAVLTTADRMTGTLLDMFA